MNQTLKTIPKFFLLLCIVLLGSYSILQQESNAYPLDISPDRGYAPLKNIDYSDTNNVEVQRIIASLDSFYQLQQKLGFNGSVLVGHKGNIVFERYLGYCDKTDGTMLCQQAPSQLASTSKPFTATAVLFLHQSGYLNIDKPVKTYIPEFPYSDITVTMLLNHRSGLPDYTKMGGKYWKSAAPMYNEDLLQIFVKNKFKQRFATNTRFEYSNTNYAFLALIVERVSKLPFKQFMKEFIFEPLGMENTFVFDPADNTPELTTVSYRGNWSIFPNNHTDGIYGDKGIYSTVRDLYKWDQSFYKNTLLTNRTIRMAYAGYSFEKVGEKNYGLGWRMLEMEDNKIIFHNGWWHGNNTVFYRFIADNFTIIVLGNKYNPKIYGHAKSIYSIVNNVSEADVKWDENESNTESTSDSGSKE